MSSRGSLGDLMTAAMLLVVIATSALIVGLLAVVL